MSSPVLQAWKRLGVVVLSASMLYPVFAENTFLPQGSEYPIAGLLPGDQVFPHVSVQASSGYLVWHDNATDGDGFGISARRLKGNLLGNLSVFRVNSQGAGDQQNPRVAMLSDGSGVIVWQGGPQNAQDIYARFIGPDGTFSTGEIRVNSFTNGQQGNPAVAVTSQGKLFVVWSSLGQDGSLQGIYGQWLAASGQKEGGEFQINQYTPANQRTPAVAALKGGEIVVAWISEQQRFDQSIDVYARVFGGGRSAVQNEFLINTSTNLCANPVLAPMPDGGFLAGWSQRDRSDAENAWDVFARSFNAQGAATSDAMKVNTHQNGNHYAPQIAAIDDEYLVVWTSNEQDGSREGVFGRFITSGLVATSPEFQVNGSTPSHQIYPTVASDGVGQFVVVWSSFVGGRTSFDLLAQQYAPSAVKAAAPFVAAISSSKLSVSWPDATAQGVSAYELYIDNHAEPVVLTANVWTASGFAPGTAHSFRLAYRFASGGKSLLSPEANGTTWGTDENLDGLPDDWQTAYWGENASGWADPKVDSDHDGATNLQEFLAGTNPTDSQSVLKTALSESEQGTFLSWNTQPGFVYQVQSKTDVSSEWTDVGGPRFAAGSSDSMLIDGAGTAVYYRVKRLR